MKAAREAVARAMCDDFLKTAFGEMGWDGRTPANAEEIETRWRNREYEEQKEMWLRAADVAIDTIAALSVKGE